MSMLKDKIKAEVINARFLKPLDKDTILTSIRKTKKFTNKQKLDLYFELDDALAKKDIRAIVKIYNKCQ